MENPVFDALAACRRAGSDLAARPVRERRSSSQALQPDTPVAVSCVPVAYQRLSDQWADRSTVHVLDEAEREVNSPDITPPYGFRSVARHGRRRRVGTARKVKECLLGDLPPVFPSEDSVDTEAFPAIREVQAP